MIFGEKYMYIGIIKNTKVVPGMMTLMRFNVDKSTILLPLRGFV